ncbi:MAG: hypothetical protein NZL98_04715, partial [Anaerolineales bacterium]|nr:hypothetical protein [Anaerolineales bacterium]MDW8227416.1 hypothetical protein [Anaerolineales bacterium]
ENQSRRTSVLQVVEASFFSLENLGRLCHVWNSLTSFASEFGGGSVKVIKHVEKSLRADTDDLNPPDLPSESVRQRYKPNEVGQKHKTRGSSWDYNKIMHLNDEAFILLCCKESNS